MTQLLESMQRRAAHAHRTRHGDSRPLRWRLLTVDENLEQFMRRLAVEVKVEGLVVAVPAQQVPGDPNTGVRLVRRCLR